MGYYGNKFVQTKMRLKSGTKIELQRDLKDLRDLSDLSDLLDLSDLSDLSDLLIFAFKKTRDGTTERRTDGQTLI